MTHTRRQLTALLETHDLGPSRALGQNFVVDPNTVRRIARLANVGPDVAVVEIGAGLGSLTLALAETGAEVVAVETDRHLIPVLREVVADQPGVTVVHADALKLDWAELLAGHDQWVLVANLPYNVATPLVLDLLADVAIPIGDYDNTKSLNIGQNRWYGRLGFPIVWQFGSWVPGRRTTLEFLPAAWFFGTNTDFVGQTLKTDPIYQLDAHLTRDFTEHLWGSLDLAWYNGGQASVNGVAGEKLNNLGVGFTLGYQVNSNLGLTFGYKSTVNDNAPGDLKMDGFMISLVYAWHPLIEGSRRLKSE